MHLDKKREEQLEKMEFELEKEYNQEQVEEQKSSEMIIESEKNMKEKTDEFQQIETTLVDTEEISKKKKRDLFFELTLFFILGVLIGITIKTEAVKKITIGFNDYQIPAKAKRYDLFEIKRNLLQQAAREQEASSNQQPVTSK